MRRWIFGLPFLAMSVAALSSSKPAEANTVQCGWFLGLAPDPATNIIPVAYNFPNGTSVRVDVSYDDGTSPSGDSTSVLPGSPQYFIASQNGSTQGVVIAQFPASLTGGCSQWDNNPPFGYQPIRFVWAHFTGSNGQACTVPWTPVTGC